MAALELTVVHLSRPATAPTRRFSPADLAGLDPTIRRQICHALLVETGLRVGPVEEGADFVDFVVETVPVWRPRRALVRLLHRAATSDDVTRVAELTAARSLSEGTVIETAPQLTQLPTDDRVLVVRARTLLTRMEASALIQWTGGAPAVDRELFAFLRQREGALAHLDAIGLRWLPWLSRNKVPPALAGRGVPADALFEEAAFRAFVMVFAFSGRRLGVRLPGTAAPDSLLFLPDRRTAALLDCKAARDAYRMSASDYRALREYLEAMRSEAAAAGRSLDFVVILSSRFSGADDQRHPYFGRARQFRREASVGLAYVRADDLTRFALRLEESAATYLDREAIDWRAIFSDGRLTETTLMQHVP
jgi:hypothetical protein